MTKRLLMSVLLAAAAGTAQAGAIEDLFKGLIEKYKDQGKTLLERPFGLISNEITKPEILPRQDTLELGKGQYAMFTAPGCRTCRTAAERLRQRGFKVEELDIYASKTAREAFELTGAKGVPTVLAGKRMLSGYSDKLFNQLITSDIQDTIRQQQGSGA